MALTLKVENAPFNVKLSTLGPSEVFMVNGQVYLLLEHVDDDWREERRQPSTRVFNLTGRYPTVMDSTDDVLPVDATLAVHGPQMCGLTHAEISILRNPPAGSSGKIHAIKLLRERTGIGLRESKERVDAACIQLGIG